MRYPKKSLKGYMQGDMGYLIPSFPTKSQPANLRPGKSRVVVHEVFHTTLANRQTGQIITTIYNNNSSNDKNDNNMKKEHHNNKDFVEAKQLPQS